MLSRNDKEKANLNSRKFLWVSANTHASAKQFFMDFSFHHQLQENSMQAINKEYLMNRRNSSFFFLAIDLSEGQYFLISLPEEIHHLSFPNSIPWKDRLL